MIKKIIEIWKEAVKEREYDVGKYILLAKPFSLTIKKKD